MVHRNSQIAGTESEFMRDTNKSLPKNVIETKHEPVAAAQKKPTP